MSQKKNVKKNITRKDKFLAMQEELEKIGVHQGHTKLNFMKEIMKMKGTYNLILII